MAIVLIIIGTIFWILVDEVMMSICQRRIGPLNIGWYGLLSAIINGLNLVLTNSIVPVVTMSSHVRFIIMMIVFFGCSLIPAYFLYPFLILDSTMSAFVIFIPIFISLFSLIFVSIYGSSKYSLLGSLRLISQFIGTELVFTSLLLILVWAYFMWSVGQFIVQLQSFQTIFAAWFILATLICILAESNRVPFDIPEAESELVAGFLTEISSIYFSILILAEYSSIIALTYFLIMAFHLVPGILVIILSFFSLVRSSLARLKYDEYQILFWLYIIPILFAFLLIALCTI